MKIDKNSYLLMLAKNSMNTRDLAKECGIGESTLSKIINGLSEPRPATLGRIAKVLGVDVEKIVKEVKLHD